MRLRESVRKEAIRSEHEVHQPAVEAWWASYDRLPLRRLLRVVSGDVRLSAALRSEEAEVRLGLFGRSLCATRRGVIGVAFRRQVLESISVTGVPVLYTRLTG